jgi:adenosylcobinamide kinase/adenosylcobinamide-phosphate guanylyltransferase
VDLTGAFAQAAGYDAILCDCLTLWVNNLMYTAAQHGETLHEEQIIEHCRALITAARRAGACVIFVTNEVGMGIVPEDADSRRFRDLIGRCNQEMAAAVDEVIWMVSGLSLQLKGSSDF